MYYRLLYEKSASWEVAQADLEMISKVSTALIAGAESVDVLDDYLNSKSFEETPALQQERGVLAVGRLSKTLGVPVEIVWFNQTQILRFLTITDDELLIRRYAETVIRRTFNTPDSMKLARPVQNETAYFMLLLFF